MAILSYTGTGFSSEPSGSFAKRVKAAHALSSEFSMESESFMSSMENGSVVVGDLQKSLKKLHEALCLESSLDDEMQENPQGMMSGATLLGLTDDNAARYLRMLTTESKNSSNVPVASCYGGIEYDNVYTTESFDNQTLNEYMPVSIGLAYTTGRQSPAFEAIYRTVALTPEQGGVDVEVPMLYTANTLQHAADGSPSDFNFRRVIDSSIDYRILIDNVTRIIPTYNATTAANFAAEAKVTPWVETDGSRSVETSALAVGKEINLFGIGNLDMVSRSGQPDYTEALDRNIGLDKIWLNLGEDTFEFPVKGIPFSHFQKLPEQGSRKLVLSLPLTTLTISGNSTVQGGGAPAGTVFNTIATSEYKVNLKVDITGSVDVERGVISVNPGVVSVKSITNSAGELVSLTETTAASIVSGLSAMTVAGWYPDARLTNSNHRHLGLMLNIRSVKERLTTRTRSPIFVPVPTTEDRDQTVLEWLTYTTLKQKEADGLTQLIAYHERMMELTGGLRGELTPGDYEENAMPIEGIGRYLINPYVQTVEVELDTTQTVDTLTKVKNGQETLINTVRSIWFDIMQRTNYDNAAKYLDGGQITKPYKCTVLGSDTINRFMTMNGDSRTLGANVPFEIYGSVDQRLKDGNNDKDYMYMVITREGEGIDPLTSGVLLNTASLVSMLTVTRDNSHRKEIVVQPRYAHYNLCPIIVRFDVTGAHTLLEETVAFKTYQTNTLAVEVTAAPTAP